MSPPHNLPFEAILVSGEGNTLARGHAHVNQESKRVTFESDFVPLYPIGTPMMVFRIYKGAKIHRFDGEVYVSHKNRMSLVSTDDLLLPGCHKVYCDQLELEAILTPPLHPKGLLRRILRKGAHSPVPVVVRELSEKHVVFQFSPQVAVPPVMDVGEDFTLNFPGSSLPKLTGVVENTFPLGAKPTCHCRLTIGDGEAKAVDSFMKDHVFQHRKLF